MTEQAVIPNGYQVRDFVDVAQLTKDLAFSPANLSDAMMQQAAMFSHYGVLAAEASRQVDVVKLLLETTEAAIDNLFRSKAVSLGEKTTEAQLEKRVSREARVIGMKQALNEAKRIEATAKTAVEAFRHKRDMLIQMGLISREEMKGDLRINGSAYAQTRQDAEDAQRERTRANAARLSARNATQEAQN